MRPVEEFELFYRCAYTISVNQYGTWGGDTGCCSATARIDADRRRTAVRHETEEAWSSQTGSSYG
jgi:hypothetical protein